MEQELTNEILALLNNEHTTVKELIDIKGNYYNYITDTIYLTTNIDKGNDKRLDKTNLFCARLVTTCHECIHSIQSKAMHILNLALSNLSIIVTIIAIILMAAFNKPTWYIVGSCIIVFLAILIRLVMEIDAIRGSLNLAEKAVNTLKIENISAKDINEARKITKKLFPLQIVRMILDKIIMLVILVI